MYNAYNWEDIDSYNNGFKDFDDYDYEEELIVLEPSWYVYYDDKVELVGDRFLQYDIFTRDLYLVDYNETSIKLADNAMVFDENCEEFIF
jgi:hypothetical protein